MDFVVLDQHAHADAVQRMDAVAVLCFGVTLAQLTARERNAAADVAAARADVPGVRRGRLRRRARLRRAERQLRGLREQLRDVATLADVDVPAYELFYVVR